MESKEVKIRSPAHQALSCVLAVPEFTKGHIEHCVSSVLDQDTSIDNLMASLEPHQKSTLTQYMTMVTVWAMEAAVPHGEGDMRLHTALDHYSAHGEGDRQLHAASDHFRACIAIMPVHRATVESSPLHSNGISAFDGQCVLGDLGDLLVCDSAQHGSTPSVNKLPDLKECSPSSLGTMAADGSSSFSSTIPATGVSPTVVFNANFNCAASNRARN